MNQKEKIIDIFEQTAQSLEQGKIGKKITVGITTIGSEHGEKNMIDGAILAKKLYPNIDIELIGPKNDSNIKTHIVDDKRDMYNFMEELLENKKIDACVTMNYNFPVGVSTVGKYISPALGRQVYLASTSGLSSHNKIKNLVRNMVNGLAVAKTYGIKQPTIGIMNTEGVKIAKSVVEDIINSGYEIKMGESIRYKDEALILRGNDVINPEVDVIVCDSLMGNMLIKIFSTYSSGGNFESVGHGYGIAVGDGYDKNILIISSASGPNVIANSVKYAYDMVQGKILRVSKREYTKLKQTNYEKIIEKYTSNLKGYDKRKAVMEKKQKDLLGLTETITGLDHLQMISAMELLESFGIDSSSACGCIRPVIKVGMDDLGKSINILKEHGYL